MIRHYHMGRRADDHDVVAPGARRDGVEPVIARAISLLSSLSHSTELATADAEQPVAAAQRDGAEGALQKRHVDHHHLQGERQANRRPQPAIREQVGERAVARPTAR